MMSQTPERILPQLLRWELFTYKFSNPFLRRIEEHFYQSQIYEMQDPIENARKKIPGAKLRERVMEKHRLLQEDCKKGLPLPSDIHDLMVIELLHWFKEEFFFWVDCPDCEHCGNRTVFADVINDSNDIYSKRTEVFICGTCNQMTLFPRYTDVNMLLETRAGRCGEWANVFTLMCWSFNLEARIVIDETDHVWTEVYSRYQKRWLHCDPCEGICDSPLMYEHGWKKKLSYVIAYSPFEVQDVTWRYTSNFKEVLKRRTKCTEQELATAISQLRNERLSRYSRYRQEYIKKRAALELVEFLTERKPSDELYEGRKSGSTNWRKSRGEITEEPKEDFSFIAESFPQMEFRMKYSCSSDRYDCETNFDLDRWDLGTYSQVNMMRKVEKDWNKVYLCRKEGTETGTIVWMFLPSASYINISSVYIKFESETFGDGKVEVTAMGRTSDDKEISCRIGEETSTADFLGCRFLQITANVSGGTGSNAWQHAQLFRQDYDCEEVYYPFEVFLTFEYQAIDF